ncbi:MAG: S26 family signal peptidase, partial [Firmicutes bacterium]|nr:S26 family signal peptidase [Bacillota bacterium]
MNIEENKNLNEIEQTVGASADEGDISAETQAVKKDSAKTILKEWIRDIAIAIVIAVLILQFIKPTIVKESSMEPTLYE